MAKETCVQRKLLMDRMILKHESTGGLGYQDGRQNEVTTNGTMIHMSSFKAFHKSINANEVKRIVKTYYFFNEEQFWIDFAQKVHDHAYLENNVAIQIYSRKNSPYNLKFRDEMFKLFVPFKQSTQDVNQWVAIEEFEYRVSEELVRRPDITFWLNGICFSVLELKHIFNNQSAHDGVSKITQNFIDTVVEHKKAYNRNKRIDNKIALNTYTKLYTSAIQCIALDGKNLFVNRRLRFFESTVHHIKKNNYDDSDIKEEIKQSFEQVEPFYPDDSQRNLEAMLHLFYTKEHIQDEIAILNFGTYSTGIDHKVTDNTKKMVTPRHKQFWALRKITTELKDRLAHEDNPDYVMEKEEKRLREQPFISEDEVNKAIEKRLSYSNDRDTDSFLLQYSAGFGKTNTMIYLMQKINRLIKSDSALYEDNNQSHLYDKIIVVTDRNDLNEQFYRNIKGSNVDKGNVCEISQVKNTNEQSRLQNALHDSNVKFIIMTVQSFGQKSIEKLPQKTKDKLASIRYAIIIDEVHRTQNGHLNNQMMSLFTNMAGNHKHRERNLVIGLTATPTEEILQQYGHFVKFGIEGSQWKSFDYYSLSQAIADGFVLDPMQNTISLTTTLNFDDKDIKDEHKLPSGELIYNNKDFIQKTAKEFSRVLQEHTFNKIGKQGKAMLVSYSKAAAQRYRYALIENGIAEEKVYIVFTENNQKNTSLKELNPHVDCKGNTQKKIVETFLSDKQAVIIVVDMLQTGFDDPRLHTLLLAKPVRDISAVQLGCRINRIHPYKKNCLIVDASYKNSNIKSFNEAFKKYEGLVISEMNESQHIRLLKRLYPKLKKEAVYKDLFNDVMNCVQNNEFIGDFVLIDKVKKRQSEVKQFIEKANQFIASYEKLSGVIVNIKEEFAFPNLDVFKRILNSIIKDRNLRESVSFKVENSTLSPDFYNLLAEDKKPSDNDRNKQKKDNNHKNQLHDIAAKIQKENHLSQTIQECIDEFEDAKESVFNKLIEKKSKAKWLDADKLSDNSEVFNKKFPSLLSLQDEFPHKELWKEYIANDVFLNEVFEDFMNYLKI